MMMKGKDLDWKERDTEDEEMTYFKTSFSDSFVNRSPFEPDRVSLMFPIPSAISSSTFLPRATLTTLFLPNENLDDREKIEYRKDVSNVRSQSKQD